MRKALLIAAMLAATAAQAEVKDPLDSCIEFGKAVGALATLRDKGEDFAVVVESVRSAEFRDADYPFEMRKALVWEVARVYGSPKLTAEDLRYISTGQCMRSVLK